MYARLTLLASSVALGLVHSVWAAPATQPSLPEQMQAIRSRIDELEARQKQANADREAAERKLEERQTAAMLSDASVRHDQFLTAEGVTAGYSDGRFFICSADGNFLFRPMMQLQFRDTTLDRKDFILLNKKQDSTKDEIDNGFTVRRLKFIVDGNVFGKDLTYYISVNTQRTSARRHRENATGATVGTVTNSAGGAPQLDQAYVKYHIPDSPFSLKAGEMKDPVYHEQLVATHHQQAIERSIAPIFSSMATITPKPPPSSSIPIRSGGPKRA